MIRYLAGAVVLTWAVGNLAAWPGGNNKPVAVVNGVNISMADVDAVLKPLLEKTAVEVPADRRKAMQMEALTLLMDDVLMQQFLEANAPAVPSAEVNKKLAEVADSLRQQGKTLAQFYKESGTNEAQMRKDLTARLQWAAYSGQHVSEADVQKCYQEYKDFFDGTTVKASHIALRLPAGTSEADKTKARSQLTELRAQLLAGKVTFADAAKKYSHCPSGRSGGDLGYIPRLGADIDDNFTRAAFALQVNQISEVVETEFGYHLIWITDRKPGQPSDYNKVKEMAREMCAQQLWQNILTQQRKTAKVEMNLQ
jgi:peptidyl-prolyl cis-trans isomerase C